MINTARIQELKDEVGEDDLVEVIELFCEEVEDVLRALDSTPQDQMAAQLHFLKGSALNIGLDDVSELCEQQENRLKSDPVATADVNMIRVTYAASKEALLKPGTSRPRSRLFPS
jgi:HPt (histidine-containing phosphotransfer) domain-containing protein